VNIPEWQETVHALAREKGWWNEEKPRGIPECLALVHSEISEALEEYRNGNAVRIYTNGDSKKPEGMGVELADAVIRIMDLCEWLSIDLEYCMKRKHEYNKTRPFRHGKVV